MSEFQGAVVTPVILSGGAGARLWPASRSAYPKQFLPLYSDRTMIQETLTRVTGPSFASPIVVCAADHRFIVAEQMRQINVKDAQIILEPSARNTAPAAAVAALQMLAVGNDGPMLLMPSDHAIQDHAAFLEAIAAALPAAQAGALVTFGIRPAHAETGYGYIKIAAQLAGSDAVFGVDRFVEKPDSVTAEAYLADGSYVWNSGIFLLSPQTYVKEVERLNPAMLAACRAAIAGAKDNSDFLWLDPVAFDSCPSDSIDYAVMEKTSCAAVVPVQMGWNDLGAWSALWEVGAKDESGTVCVGDVIALNTQDCYLRADHRVVAVAGVRDLVVVETDDAVLVTHRQCAQEIKEVVSQLKAADRYEHSHHTTVCRPWGNYRSIDAGERFQVKRIVVQPGERLSLQKHYHRAEHWIVVAGTALVTRCSETFQLNENESTFIRAGEVHRLENPGKLPLHLIEVQSGSYLGEDDIVRYEDGYGRINGDTVKVSG